MDGSFHPWLEERGSRGCLMHMVDDATTKALGWFTAEESIWAAVAVLRRWIEEHFSPMERALRKGHFFVSCLSLLTRI